MNITLTINEQVVSRIIEAVVKALAQPMLNVPNASTQSAPQPSQELEALQKQVASLQKELAQAKAQPKPMAKSEFQAQAVAKPQEVKPNEMQSQKPTSTAQSQAKPNGNGKGLHTSPDTLKAEQWAHEHVAEWLDQPCPFAKAQKRSWKELAENVGEKIIINGRASQPRAYLHVLEGWNDCNGWAKTKAKVALEIIPSKNGNGSQVAK